MDIKNGSIHGALVGVIAEILQAILAVIGTIIMFLGSGAEEYGHLVFLHFLLS